MTDAYLKADHKALQPFHIWNDMGLAYIPGLKNTFIAHLVENQIDKHRLPSAKLGRDIVLPTGWHPSSIVNSLGMIGHGRRAGAWEADSNHQLHYWYPMNVFWVGGGNHSITVGIALAEGTVSACEGYDLSSLYPFVKFNGICWVDSESGEKIGVPRYKEFGYLFEIGRMILNLTAND